MCVYEILRWDLGFEIWLVLGVVWIWVLSRFCLSLLRMGVSNWFCGNGVFFVMFWLGFLVVWVEWNYYYHTVKRNKCFKCKPYPVIIEHLFYFCFWRFQKYILLYYYNNTIQALANLVYIVIIVNKMWISSQRFQSAYQSKYLDFSNIIVQIFVLVR